MYTSIRPGQVWLDTEGKRIQAHGGSIFYENGKYYWYGENKEKTDGKNGIWHWGVRMYESRDLYNWKDLGLIIPPEPDKPESPLHPTACMDRPHIIYNAATKKYVCWLKIMEKDGSQRSTVLTAGALTGPYTMVRTGLKPLNMSAGDFDLVVAPDGKAYYYFERVHSETICADLTADYTDVTGYYSTHFPRPYPPYVREATALCQNAPSAPVSIRPMCARPPPISCAGASITSSHRAPPAICPTRRRWPWAQAGTAPLRCWAIPARTTKARPPITPRFPACLRCPAKRICTSPAATAGPRAK